MDSAVVVYFSYVPNSFQETGFSSVDSGVSGKPFWEIKLANKD